MAYQNFSEIAGAATLAAPVRAAAKKQISFFSALEWSVVTLARMDRVSSLREPGWLTRAFRILFGFGRSPRLADPRLEALRRMSVLAWHHGYQVPQEELKVFLSAGFSIDEFESLLASVSQSRAGRKWRVHA